MLLATPSRQYKGSGVIDILTTVHPHGVALPAVLPMSYFLLMGEGEGASFARAIGVSASVLPAGVDIAKSPAQRLATLNYRWLGLL